MPVPPVVRYMLLCNDWRYNHHHQHRIDIFGLLSNVRSHAQPPYPLINQELYVVLVLTEGYGTGRCKISIVFDESGDTIFETVTRSVQFGPDPLAIKGVSFHIRNCLFPNPGVYTVQFWYDGDCISEKPLLMR